MGKSKLFRSLATPKTNSNSIQSSDVGNTQTNNPNFVLNGYLMHACPKCSNKTRGSLEAIPLCYDCWTVVFPGKSMKEWCPWS